MVDTKGGNEGTRGINSKGNLGIKSVNGELQSLGTLPLSLAW